MGTDRVEIYRGQCPCGKGQVIINFCTPDHPWPTQSKWFETSVMCDECDKNYSLIEQQGHFVFVEKSELERRDEYWGEYSRKSDALMSHPNVVKMLQELEHLLDSQKSMAAIHRLLQAHHLDYYSIGTFRKRWSGGRDWIKNNIRPNNLKNVLELLGKTDKYIEEELTELEKLYEKHKEPLQIIGRPVIDVSQYKH